MSISDPKGREIEKQMSSGKMVKKFDVKQSGQHQICLTNQAQESVKFEMEIKTGDWSSDTAQSITKKHFRPVEAQAYKVNQMVE